MHTQDTTTATTGPETLERPVRGKPFDEGGFPANSPLFPHRSGCWAKKVNGKLVYYGRWKRKNPATGRVELTGRDGWEAAKIKYVTDPDGKAPPADPDNPRTLGQLCALFMESKERSCQKGKINARGVAEYQREIDAVLNILNPRTSLATMRPAKFNLLLPYIQSNSKPGQETANLVTQSNRVRRIRAIFIFAYKNGYVDRPFCFGSEFVQPSRNEIAKERNDNPTPETYTKEEIHLLLKYARQPLKTMILMAINAGLGNHDFATLKWSHINFHENGETAWLNYPRHKTGNAREAPLWKETVAALKDWRTRRPTPTGDTDRDLVFITRYGNAWGNPDSPMNLNPVGKALDKVFARILKDDPNSTIHHTKRGFYALRHTFRTEAGGVIDEEAVNFIMGHVDNRMAARYIARYHPERLQRVVDFVHDWLFTEVKQSNA
ncbi:tyrosine-type recombinase/integrase [Botrimarina sp.]|uniref:tyrosine-type recombinase/integrase n=1 Tax=Botrimarina sp. TaxID=2795802 RepID=UPI0032EF99C2